MSPHSMTTSPAWLRPAEASQWPGRKPWSCTRLCVALGGLFLIAACQAQPPSASRAAPAAALHSDREEEAALLARIKAEIGDARCDSQAQCHTLAIGEKACGGPETWLAWSTASANGDALTAWAAELAALQRRRNARSGIQSTCVYNADPGATCQAGHCVIRTSGGAV